MNRFLNAIGFLTIIKIPQKFYPAQKDYPSMLAFFTLAGFLIGVLNSALFFGLNLIFPLILSMIIVCGFEILITGAIHIDGLADTFDGVFSGETDKNRIISIMKKGDIGVFGALAILFSIMLKIAFLYFLAKQLLPAQFLSLNILAKANAANLIDALPAYAIFFSVMVFAPVFGRLSMLYLISTFGPAKQAASLAGSFKNKSNRAVYILNVILCPAVFISASTFLKMWYFNGFSVGDFKVTILTLVVYAASALTVVLLTILSWTVIGRFFTQKIGGVSGDIIGAVCVLSELLFLFFSYIFIVIIFLPGLF